MRMLLLGVALPILVPFAAFLPVCTRSDAIRSGEEQHARRLTGQAAHWSDIRPGWPVVREMRVGDPENLYDAEGRVDWLGPFGVSVLSVSVGVEGSSSPRPWRALAAWGGFLAALVAGPAAAFVMGYRGS
jgi:hypothetical protein